MISPTREGANPDEAKRVPIACGVLGGFGGFLHESFRRHDYLLGRRNAQAFLAGACDNRLCGFVRRKAALVKAFGDTMQDAEFRAEAARETMEIDPMAGGEIDALLTRLYATAADVVAKAARAISD